MLKQKIYLPLIGNGGGQGKLTWTASMMAGIGGLAVHVDPTINDSHPDRAMNKAAANFLASDCDAWVNIDADIEFTRVHLQRLLSHDVGLVYGIYPKKDLNTEPCVCNFPLDQTPAPREDGLVQVRRAGRGFMCVRKPVLEMMKEENGGPAEAYDNHKRPEWDFFHSGVFSREWLSEDWLFCDRAWALGIPTLVDPRIVLGHEGSLIYRFGDHQTT